MAALISICRRNQWSVVLQFEVLGWLMCSVGSANAEFLLPSSFLLLPSSFFLSPSIIFLLPFSFLLSPSGHVSLVLIESISEFSSPSASNSIPSLTEQSNVSLRTMSWNILCLPLILQKELIAFSKAEHILKSNQVLIVCEASLQRL